MRRLEEQLCTVIRKRVLGQRCRVPDAGADLMQVFRRLSHARSFGAHGPNPISFTDIDAWCRLMRVPLQPAHVAIICAMDRAFMEAWCSKRDAGQADGAKTLPPISQQPLNAALLDAVMG